MRNQEPKKFLMDLYENFVPELRYNGGSVAEWQKTARQKLSDLLGLQYMVKCDYDFRITSTEEREDYTQVHFTFQSEPGYYVAACIRLRRDQKAGCKPIICIQGHSRGMHISLGEPKNGYDEQMIKGGDRDFCNEAFRQGFTPVTVEQRYMGENGGNEQGPCCYFFREGKITAHQTLLYGRTAIGERVWDVMNLITVLGENFDCLDMNSVHILGNSGGGTTTIYVAAMDERVSFAIPSSAVCSYRPSIINNHHCTCNYIPGIARYFDMGDLCALTAPRKLIIVSSELDTDFPKAGAIECFEVGRKVYDALGAGDNIGIVIGPEGHRFYAKQAYELYNKMK